MPPLTTSSVPPASTTYAVPLGTWVETVPVVVEPEIVIVGIKRPHIRRAGIARFDHR